MIHAIAFSSTFTPLRFVFIRVVKRAAPLFLLLLVSLNACASSCTDLRIFRSIGGRGSVRAPPMSATNRLMYPTTVSRLVDEANKAACLALRAFFFLLPFLVANGSRIAADCSSSRMRLRSAFFARSRSHCSRSSSGMNLLFFLRPKQHAHQHKVRANTHKNTHALGCR